MNMMSLKTLFLSLAVSLLYQTQAEAFVVFEGARCLEFDHQGSYRFEVKPCASTEALSEIQWTNDFWFGPQCIAKEANSGEVTNLPIKICKLLVPSNFKWAYSKAGLKHCYEYSPEGLLLRSMPVDHSLCD